MNILKQRTSVFFFKRCCVTLFWRCFVNVFVLLKWEKRIETLLLKCSNVANQGLIQKTLQNIRNDHLMTDLCVVLETFSSGLVFSRCFSKLLVRFMK